MAVFVKFTSIAHKSCHFSAVQLDFTPPGCLLCHREPVCLLLHNVPATCLLWLHRTRQTAEFSLQLDLGSLCGPQTFSTGCFSDCLPACARSTKDNCLLPPHCFVSVAARQQWQKTPHHCFVCCRLFLCSVVNCQTPSPPPAGWLVLSLQQKHQLVTLCL